MESGVSMHKDYKEEERGFDEPGKDVLRRIAALVLGLLLVTAYAIAAQTNGWTRIGPDGGFVQTIVPDPRNPSILYLISDARLYRSTDGGDSWNYAFGNISNVLVNPQTSEVYIWSSSNLWKSADRGKTFHFLLSGPQPDRIVPCPHDPNLLAGLEYGQLLFTGGKSLHWSPNGLSPFTQRNGRGIAIRDFLFSPVQKGVFYLSVDFYNDNLDTSTPALLVSFNQGRTWRVVENKPYTFWQDPNYPGRAFAFSFDGIWEVTGPPWVRISGFGINSWSTLSSVPRSPAEFYHVDSYGKVFHSTDGARTWMQVFSKAPFEASPYEIRGITPLGGPYHTLLVPARLGVFRRDDHSDWKLSSSGIHGLSLTQLQTSTGATLFGSYSDIESTFFSFHTSWSIRQFRYADILVDPFQPLHWFRVMQNMSESRDGGKTWNRLGPFDWVFFDPGLSGHLLLYRSRAGAYFESRDGGRTREQLPLVIGNTMQVFFEGVDRSTLYFFTTSGILRTSDGGRTLSRVDAGLHPGESQSMSAEGPPGHFLTITSHHEIFETLDRGDHWKKISQLPAAKNGSSYPQIESADPLGHHLYAIGGFHLFESLDHGRTWTDLNEKLDGASVLEMTAPQNPNFYVGTNRGVYKKKAQP